MQIVVSAEHVQKFVARPVLQLLVGAVYFAVEILDGRGQIARHHLAALVVQRIQHRFGNIGRIVTDFGVDDGEGVREQRDLPGVLHDIFLARGTHERPTLNVFHSV